MFGEIKVQIKDKGTFVHHICQPICAWGDKRPPIFKVENILHSYFNFMTFYGRLTDSYTEVIWLITSDSLVVSAIRFRKI